MRVVAAIRADLDRSDIGTRSRLADEIDAVPVLRRTVERLCHVEQLAATYVLCSPSDHSRCERMLTGLPAVVRSSEFADSGWRALVRSARKWSLDGWRGGLGGATYFDEFIDLPLLRMVVTEAKADAVLAAPAAAPGLSGALAEKMIAHRKISAENARLVFTQAVPGLAGILLDAGLVAELAEKGMSVGSIFAYKPDSPRKDLIFQPCCLDLPADLRFAAGRLVADTDRSVRRVRDLLNALPGETDAGAIGRWLRRRDETFVDRLPHEVEIELTTEDRHPDSVLRPRGERVGSRGPIPIEHVRALACELGELDDTLVVLGGYGDPLRHPDFNAIIETLRPQPGRGVYGLAVRTVGLDLDDLFVEGLIRRGVDVLNILLDAWTPATYAAVHRPGEAPGPELAHVMGNLQRVSDLRHAAGSVLPIVVPEFCKSRDNLAEMDEFFDGWVRRLGTVSVVGYSRHAGQLPSRAVADMRPPTRMPCRRIGTRCTVLADGTVVQCDQDYRGVRPIGRVPAQKLTDAWTSEHMDRLRAAHHAGAWGGNSLCAVCEEWHRP